MKNLTNAQIKGIKADTYALREFLKTVQKGEYNGVIEKIKKDCLMNDHRFLNIKAGLIRIKPLEFEKINAIAGYDILEKHKQ